MQTESLALAVLIGVLAIIVGYVVRLIVPAKHFPWTAGLLAANVVVAGFAYAGIGVPGDMLETWLILSGIVWMFFLSADLWLKG